MSSQNKATKKGEQMIAYTFRLPPSLLEQAKQRSGFITLPRLLRILLVKYLRGEVKISDEDAKIE
jgi:hypothetical protein